MRFVVSCLFFLFSLGIAAQQTATIKGRVIDDQDNTLRQVTVTVLGRQSGIEVSDSGTFSIIIPARKNLALVFAHPDFKEQRRSFYLSPGETEQVLIKMFKSSGVLQEVIVRDNRDRQESGLIKIDAQKTIELPGAVSGVEGLIKTIVGSNNELTSNYSVRGGNYDENLFYINDFEVYRPYLITSGQQEGLSVINPDLVKNINFYTGGFPAKYGDKISSVLDIQYMKPANSGGSVYLGFLEQGLSLHGNAAKKKLSYVAGVRNKSNSNLLQSQQTKGAYLPSSADMQGLVTYQLNDKLSLELLGIYSVSKFDFYPVEAQKTAAVFSPVFSSALGLDIYFEGQEKDRFKTSLAGLTLNQKINRNLTLKWMVGNFRDVERVNYNIGAAYLFGERDFDPNTGTSGGIINPLGAGYYLDYARNHLQIEEWSFTNRGQYKVNNHLISWGASLLRTHISDKINQFQYQDSAGYSIPLNSAQIFESVYGNNIFDINKYVGFLQDNISFRALGSRLSLQAGLRLNYNDANNEMLVSPRVGLSIAPDWKRDIIFKLAGGMYNQPPFYREMRTKNGSLNTTVKAQKSWQATGGFDYNFLGWEKRPFKLNVEAYYKNLWDVNVYDVENVEIIYAANNAAKALTTGIDIRLAGELVKGAESWLSIGFMRSRENLDNDVFYRYLNAAGEEITSASEDKVIADSSLTQVGWLRRPSDRLMTLGLFLEDYLSTNENFKVHVNMIYGSNLPYNISGNVRYRNALEIPAYFRCDLGFSVLLLSDKSVRRSLSPFRNLKDAWVSAEIFNLFNRSNTISYQMIKDFSNTSFAIPNRLTPRLVNFKLVARF